MMPILKLFSSFFAYHYLNFMILNKIDLPNEFFPGTVKNFAVLPLFPCFKPHVVLLPGGLLELCCCSSTIILHRHNNNK